MSRVDQWWLNLDMPPGWEISRAKGTNRPYFINHKDQTTTWEDPRIAYYTKKRFIALRKSDSPDSDGAAASEFQHIDEGRAKPRCDEVPIDFRDDSTSSVSSSHRSSDTENTQGGLNSLSRSATDRSTTRSRQHRSQRSGSERPGPERTHHSTRTSLRSEGSTSRHRRREGGEGSREDEPMKPLMESEEDQRALRDSATPEQTPKEDQSVVSDASTQAHTAVTSVDSPTSNVGCSNSDEAAAAAATVPLPVDHIRPTLAVGPNPALRCARITARGPDPSLRRGDGVCLAKGPNPSLHRGPNPSLLGSGLPATATTTSFNTATAQLSCLVLAR